MKKIAAELLSIAGELITANKKTAAQAMHYTFAVSGTIHAGGRGISKQRAEAVIQRQYPSWIRAHTGISDNMFDMIVNFKINQLTFSQDGFNNYEYTGILELTLTPSEEVMKGLDFITRISVSIK
jgi:hypothetical protein